MESSVRDPGRENSNSITNLHVVKYPQNSGNFTVATRRSNIAHNSKVF